MRIGCESFSLTVEDVQTAIGSNQYPVFSIREYVANNIIADTSGIFWLMKETAITVVFSIIDIQAPVGTDPYLVSILTQRQNDIVAQTAIVISPFNVVVKIIFTFSVPLDPPAIGSKPDYP